MQKQGTMKKYGPISPKKTNIVDSWMKNTYTGARR